MKHHRFIRRKSDRLNRMHRILVLLAIVPLISLFFGANSIIDSSSPAILLSFYDIMQGFFGNIMGHLYILIGALLLTAIIWDLTHDYWEK